MVKPTPAKGRGRAQQRTKNSTRIFYLALAVVAVAGIGALSWMTRRPADEGRNASPIDTTLPKVESNGYVVGLASAPLEVIEYGDFECPSCARFATLTEPDVRTRLVDKGIIRFRFIDLPLSMHRNTWPASRAAACADEQGKFWEMHDALFQTQDQWNGEATNKPNPFFKDLAKQIGLNQQQFDQCVDTKKTQAKVQAHEQLAERQHIAATPSFLIGGKIYEGPRAYDEFKLFVDSALARSGSPVATPTDSSAKKSTAKTATKR